VITCDFTGLTKRELFAAMAMQGLNSNGRFASEYSDKLSKWSVQQADALLAELAKEVT